MTEMQEKIVDLRRKGLTYREIGAAVGCSYQYAAQVACRKKDPWRGISKEQCIYKGLRDWMNENKVSVKALCKCVYEGKAGDKKATLYRKLSGGIWFKKHEIDRMTEVTGKSYEELFCYEG